MRRSMVAIPLLFLLLATAAARAAEHQSPNAASPCVLALYAPHPGMATQTESIMVRHVPLLQQLGYATRREPVRFRSAGGTYVELFEWESIRAVEQAEEDPAVGSVWSEFGAAVDYQTLKDLPEAQQITPKFQLVALPNSPGTSTKQKRKPAPAPTQALTGTVSLTLYKARAYKTSKTQELLKEKAELLSRKGYAVPSAFGILGSFKDSVMLELLIWRSPRILESAFSDPQIMELEHQLAAVSDKVTMSSLGEAAEKFPHFGCD